MSRFDEDRFDEDGYPTEETLETIRNWDCIGDYKQHVEKCHKLMAFVEGTWHYADYGFKRDGHRYYISTIGWSGNESIIDALQSNFIFWSQCWVQSNRGGHYIFEIGDEK